jgi:hypothetical protein
LPFFVPADLRSLPRLAFLIRMGLRLAATPLASPPSQRGLSRACCLAAGLTLLALSGQGGTPPS